MADIDAAVIYLIFIGMIEVREDNAIRITKLGTEAWLIADFSNWPRLPSLITEV